MHPYQSGVARRPFRPHACGVDVLANLKKAKAEFQTPRLWGGSPRCGMVDAPHSFRPHACGVDLTTVVETQMCVFQTPRLWGGCWQVLRQAGRRLSDPTPVGWMTPRCCHAVISSFRPHACGVDDRICGTELQRLFQTPRLWGGYQWFLPLLARGLSDPTPVGWILTPQEIGFVMIFRPHACGVDETCNCDDCEEEFQTPRLWGGLPHAPRSFQRFVSDPTPVGWITSSSTMQTMVSFRPHACGVDT